MGTERLETFSDGVMAVIITIMVLNLKVPTGASIHDLRIIMPGLLIYALSFRVIGTFWNNHHNLLRATKTIDARIMWANLVFLFTLSIIPYFTAWFGQHYTSAIPTAAYATALLVAGVGYNLLLRSILASDGADMHMRRVVGKDFKGSVSLLCYTVSIPLAFVSSWFSIALFIVVASIWLIPESRFKKA